MDKLAVFGLLSFVLMFGCLGMMGDESMPMYGGTGTSREALAPAYNAVDYGQQASDGTYVTKEGSITLKVPEGTLQAKFETLKDDLRAQGADTSNIVYNEYSNRKQYTLTVLVPPSKFESISAMLQQAGEVKDMSVRLEDVTKLYTDLDTRIKNKEVELERLYSLYDKSDNVSDLLSVEREVSRVETELELLKGEKQYLVSKVERSAIAITVYEEKPASTQLTLPLESLGQWFFTAVAAAISLIVVGAGFLLPIAIVAGILWFAYKKLFGGKKKGGPKGPEHSKIPPPS
ncbi:DUF4349 domain-containing protein [Candidatus Micrarchaeota archaeon]|nr:DUF4349 domain-containing protein [Candidatus Micrarchaeota archaeon]